MNSLQTIKKAAIVYVKRTSKIECPNFSQDTRSHKLHILCTYKWEIYSNEQIVHYSRRPSVAKCKSEFFILLWEGAGILDDNNHHGLLNWITIGYSTESPWYWITMGYWIPWYLTSMGYSLLYIFLIFLTNYSLNCTSTLPIAHRQNMVLSNY